jgi:hypothetical protein
MKVYTWCACKFHAYLTLAQDGGERSALTPVKKASDSNWTGGWVELSQNGHGEEGTNLALSEIEPQLSIPLYVERKSPEIFIFFTIFKNENPRFIWDAVVRAVTDLRLQCAVMLRLLMCY